MDVLPDIELGPIRDWKHTDTFRLGLPSIVEPPQFRALILRIPAVVGSSKGKYSLLCAADFFIAPRPAKGNVEAMQIERLLQALGFPHVCMYLRPMVEWIDSARLGLRVLVDDELHSGFLRH